MKRIGARLVVSALVGVIVVFAFSIRAGGGERCDDWVAKVVSVQGRVQALRTGEARWLAVALDDRYCAGDVIWVQEESRAAVVFRNDAILRLDQNTTITFTPVEEEQGFWIKLIKGAAHFFSRTPRSLRVATPFVNGAGEGTEFFVRVGPDEAFVSVFEGRVAVTNQAGGLLLKSGDSALAGADQPPVPQVVVRPRDAVQWALYYPPVMYVRPEKVTPEEAMRDPRFLTQRASQLLSVGRVDEAKADIERALSLDPNYSDAYALQSIIAVVQNDKEKALTLAQKAVELNPKSATARIALSYAQQARFDLDGARASIEEAVKLDPGNVLAWARLADLQASFGELGKALEAAKKAENLNPDLSLTQTVLGFAYLTQVEVKESKAAFEKAIRLDQAAPLPRLGLGLAKIREGDLKEGGREIEIAASLDPNNSLIRSYLGKVYYEEKRTDRDGPEYQIAKELDPNDPTPYFYDAIRKQTINRPVEALRDYQKAIELNDNRAVYRSNLLLDSDAAARQSAIARVYSDLGFQQRALVEGWQSVNTDPTNYSAHRFLADSYSALPRHQIARVSELLQSQLLQPTNITPIQPRLAESNQFLISAQGPASLSFNEFNPIFNRNQVAVQGSGLTGSNDTLAGEGVVSGIYNKLSFSAGYTYFNTDGWRDNANQTDRIGDAFVQYGFTPSTSFQTEYRYRYNKRGDIALWFFEDDFRPNLEQNSTANTWRLGFRQALSPNSIVIGNFSYQNLSGTDKELVDPTFNYKFNTDQDSYGGELQYLSRSHYFNVIAGTGYFDITGNEKDRYEFGSPPISVFNDKISLDFKHFNAYLYSYIKPQDNLTITIGASGDLENADDPLREDKNTFNPKFGITWNPLPNTTLRGAAFRVLKRTLITDQTIEPTQVAGFNQFYDEVNATDYWVYGAAVDQKFTQELYGGVGYTYRNLNVPFQFFNEATLTTTLENTNWHENILRAYLFWTPSDWLALTAEYMLEGLDRQKDLALGAKEATTNIVPLGVNFFHPSGIGVSLKGTYVDQSGKFERKQNIGVFENGNEDFWLFDAAIRYRFPNRYGFLTVGVTNLFDKHFQFFDSDLDNARFQPDRFFFAKITVALP